LTRNRYCKSFSILLTSAIDDPSHGKTNEMSDVQRPSSYPPEMPLSGLKTSELLLVTTLRLWALNDCHPEQSRPNWREGLAAARIDISVFSAFGGLMGTVAGAPLRPLDIRCMCSQFLGEDEALFLQAIALLQRHEERCAAVILSDWMPPAGVRLAMQPAHNLAAALLGAGLVIPLRAMTARPHTQSVYANPGLALVQ
jgi:hypothetical protein